MTSFVKISADNNKILPTFKIKDNEKLTKLFGAFCDVTGLPPYTTVFFYKTLVLQGNDTIRSLGIKKKNDDVIHFTCIGPSIKGIEPILNEEITIEEWLSRDVDDNIIVIDSFKDKIFCLKRSYFTAGLTINDIYLNCIINNNQLNTLKTFLGGEKNKYLKIGYYFGNKYLIDKNNIDIFQTRGGNIFVLEASYRMTAINEESLKLSEISLMKDEEKHDNILTEDDVYFNDIMAFVLLSYTYHWDRAINGYLRQGDKYFSDEYFVSNYEEYFCNFSSHEVRNYHFSFNKEKGISRRKRTKDPEILYNDISCSREQAENNIKQAIKKIDECFLKYAERTKQKSVVFRGMTTPYRNDDGSEMKKGDKIEVKSYTSTSDSIMIADRFTNKKDCCIFKLIIDEGIPYINMVLNTYFDEDEILLPRNLIFTYIKSEDYNYNGKEDGDDEPQKMITFRVSMKYPDQFNRYTGCEKYFLVYIYNRINLRVEQKKCQEGYKFDLSKECKNEKEILEEVMTLTDKLKLSNYKQFSLMDEMCDIIYQSSPIFKTTSIAYINLKINMDKCRKLGWKNYDYHFSKIFGTLESKIIPENIPKKTITKERSPRPKRSRKKVQEKSRRKK